MTAALIVAGVLMALVLALAASIHRWAVRETNRQVDTYLREITRREYLRTLGRRGPNR